eukprot:scaffold80094_cov69-Phaeocystis_antarctica.AAC.1
MSPPTACCSSFLLDPEAFVKLELFAFRPRQRCRCAIRRTSKSLTPKSRTVPTAVASHPPIHYPLYSRTALDQALTPVL